MSQTELAERLGVSRGAVGNWKAGTDQPKPHRLPEIERELELQPGTLVSALANTDDRDELLGSRVRALEVRVGQLEEEIEQIRSRS
ncbi:MAG: helix-turn-helix domain-containing protein [Actinomycetota bacterium]